MTTQYRLSAKDREQHNLPEWISFDRDKLDDTPYSVLVEWEREMGAKVLIIVSTEWPERSALGIKGYMWLALKLAGGDCPSWASFDIRVTGIKQKIEQPEADASPLEEDSSQPPSVPPTGE